MEEGGLGLVATPLKFDQSFHSQMLVIMLELIGNGRTVCFTFSPSAMEQTSAV